MKKFVILFIILILFLSLFTGCKKQETKVYKYELMALQTKNEISGNFFLGSGTINDEQYFFAYVKYNDGGIRFWKCETYNTWIYEDIINNEIPNVIYTYKNGGFFSSYFEQYEFHIPKGSILQKFNLN